MWFAYVDESKEDNSFFVYSALIVESDAWNETFAAVKAFRKHLRETYGIYINKELHAWKFAAGKGQISDRVLNKSKRAEIFSEILQFVGDCKQFKLISSVNTSEFYAFERLINRINRTAQAQNTNATLFCDEGQETVFTRRIRKMRVYNPIPSNRGIWDGTDSTVKNIPTHFIIEDPIFKKSHMSYFIQLVDFCAYALLRKERPITSRTIFGYNKMYAVLRPCIVTAVAPRCPEGLGIIR